MPPQERVHLAKWKVTQRDKECKEGRGTHTHSTRHWHAKRRPGERGVCVCVCVCV
jgi:hypothetical protein